MIADFQQIVNLQVEINRALFLCNHSHDPQTIKHLGYAPNNDHIYQHLLVAQKHLNSAIQTFSNQQELFHD